MAQRRFNGHQRAALYLASGGHCSICGVELTPGWHADHIEAWSRGGETDVVNGQALCPTCNLRKGIGTNQMTSGNRDSEPPALREWQIEALDLFLAKITNPTETERQKGINFMVEAFPASGKTRLMIEATDRQLTNRSNDAVVVIVPSRYLCYQIANDFNESYDIQLNPNWSGDRSIVTETFRGIVTTYAWTQRNAIHLRAQIARHRTLVICDEIHHAGESNEWGRALKEALEPARVRLLLTGTPFRTDKTTIPFVPVIPDGAGGLVADPHYFVRYGYCLNKKWVRPVYFHRHDGLMTWEDKDGKHEATFEKTDIDIKGRSRRLQTAIFEHGEHVGGMLRDAHRKLMELRQTDPDAAGIVWTMDHHHASQIKARMERELGVRPVIVHHDLEDGANPRNLIQGFKAGYEPWIVCVDMVSEGVSIPRLRVGVYLTNKVTTMYVTQSIGRLLRTETSHKEQSAHFYMPDDPRLRKIAEEMTEEVTRVMLMRQRDGLEPGDTGDVVTPSSRFVPISASYELKGVTVHGDYLEPSLLAYAESFKRDNPALDVPSETIAYILNKAGHTAPVTSNGKCVATAIAAPIYVQLEDLRQQNQLFAQKIGMAHYKPNPDYAAVQNALNKAAGIASVPMCEDVNALQKRLEIARKWFITGEAPKEFIPR